MFNFFNGWMGHLGAELGNALQAAEELDASKKHES